MRESFKDYCVRTNNLEKLANWHPTKNLPETPESISHGTSSKKYWWRCPKGHEWQAYVYIYKAAAHTCPVCIKSHILTPVHNLKERYPEVAAEWAYDKNKGLLPEQCLPLSHKSVWWRCSEGHEWRAIIKSRTHLATKCPICAGKTALPGFNDFGTVHPEFAKEWHPTKNRPLTPLDVTPGSTRNVWWLCPEGHEWQARIYSRARGSGCPICAGKLVIPGENDLTSAFPKIATQWHPTKNGVLTPEAVTPYSNRKVWWLCEKQHEYQATVASKTRHESGCPICSNRQLLSGFNDLATLYPQLAAQWHPTKNGALTAADVTASLHKKVWWQCEQGHSWLAQISVRTADSTDCPYCTNRLVWSGFNDLSTISPALASQWHTEKNGDITPDKILAYSQKKCWWICRLGHAWQISPGARIYKDTGCPVCSGRVVLPGFNDLESNYPEIAKEWHPTLNLPLTPQSVTTGSNRRVWWECADGHFWKTRIAARTISGTNCPICSGYVSKKRKTKYDALMREAELLLSQKTPGSKPKPNT